MNPQLIGTVLDVVKSLGGAAVLLGLFGLTTEQVNQIVTTTGAVLTAVAGLLAVVLPIIRSMRVRTKEGSLKLAESNLKPGESVVLSGTK